MRTAEQIYARIRWDPGLDEARFRIGYDAHGPQPVEVAFVDFVPGGDVPWHRIVYFAADGEVVWDRPSKIDRLDESRAGRVTAPRLLREPIFTARAPLRFDPEAGRWAASRVDTASYVDAPSTVRLATWNVLFDRHEADRIDTARRHPLLIRALEELDADVIALQEVEPAFARLLLAEPWVRASYAVSDRPRGPTLDPYGVFLLSRRPVLELAWHRLDNHKKIVAMVVAMPDRPLVIATVHLTSDHAKDGARKRSEQLAALREGLASVEVDTIVLGDFNERGDVPASALDMRDAWLELGLPPLPTFDPPNNPLARVSSATGAPLRLDRVMLRTGGDVTLTHAARIGTEPATEDGLYLSDHCGLIADLDVGSVRREVLDAPVTHRTALAWVPPEDLWPPIQTIRCAHDPRVDRWMPHVNVLYGFVPEARFDDAARMASSAARELAPFSIALEGVREFRHRSDATLWLEPCAAGSEGWQRLGAAMLARFPHQSERHRGGFRPHLSLGRIEGPTAGAREAWARSIGRLETEVRELALLSRRGDGPMEVRALVTLGSGAVRWLDPPGDVSVLRERPARAELADRIVQRLMGAGARVERVGSRRMGCAIATSDLDLVWIEEGDGDPARFAEDVRSALVGEDVRSLRLVRAARLPGVKLTVADLTVDVAYVATGAIPASEAVARRAELDEPSAAALSGVSDADAILSFVRGREEAFVALARAVKAWAWAKGLDEAPFGGLPGLAWAILAARTVVDASEPSLEAFFGTWAAFDASAPIAIGAPPPDGAPLRIATPSAPVRNCAATLDDASWSRLSEAFYEAWEIARGHDPLPRLLAPPPLARVHAAYAVVQARAHDADALEQSAGWVRGRALALLRALRAAGARDASWWPSPIVSSDVERAWAIGLGPRPISVAALREASAPFIEEHLAWPERESGARVEIRWVDGGEVSLP